MTNLKPELLVLPFMALIAGTSIHLAFDEVLSMLRKAAGTHVHIELSYPGAPHAIGWTIFRRSPRKYLYENQPLFRFERGARRYIRKAYAIHYSLTSDDGMTYSHLHL
ncbi:MAG: hypothetical protein HY863_09385 [Chloroflexi bacterium]|nr:hypothetical protein [Chloroflexota bacterium]